MPEMKPEAQDWAGAGAPRLGPVALLPFPQELPDLRQSPRVTSPGSVSP